MTQLNPFTTSPLDYQMNAAVINISNLRLRTFIGFNPEELSKQQDIVINAEIHYSADEACDSDDESRALNYKLVCKSLIEHVENGRFRLLEKLVADLLAIIMDSKQVEYASIRVDKPHALRFADSVSLSLSAKR
jgi:D-erythro-7,8-dihydroneopterin triphosphate epimerase